MMKIINEKEPVETVTDLEFCSYAKSMPYGVRTYLQRRISDELKRFESVGCFKIPGIIEVSNLYVSRNLLAEKNRNLMEEVVLLKKLLAEKE